MQNLLQISDFLPTDIVILIISETLSYSKVLFDEYRNDANKINSYLEFYKFIKFIKFIYFSLITTIYSGFINHPIVTFETVNSSKDFLFLIDSTKLILTHFTFSNYHSKVNFNIKLDYSNRDMRFNHIYSAI